MKRLLVATSFFALLLSPVAFAQSSNMSGSQSTSPSESSGSSQHSSAMSRGGSAAHVSQQEVKQAQTELKQQGLYNGQIDGVIGPETKTAISEYQKKEGLPQTASLDQQTLQHLMSTSGSGSSSNGSMNKGSMNKGSSSGSSMEHNQGSSSSESGSMGSQHGQGGQSR